MTTKNNDSRKPTKTRIDYSPKLALERIRFYVSVLEAHAAQTAQRDTSASND